MKRTKRIASVLLALVMALSLITTAFAAGETGSITIDTSLMEAYAGDISANSCMNGDFPRLQPGQNAISWSGDVTRIVVQPNWRML